MLILTIALWRVFSTFHNTMFELQIFLLFEDTVKVLLKPRVPFLRPLEASLHPLTFYSAQNSSDPFKVHTKNSKYSKRGFEGIFYLYYDQRTDRSVEIFLRLRGVARGPLMLSL